MIPNDLTKTGDGLDLPFTPVQYDLFHNYNYKFLIIPKGRRWGITAAFSYVCIKALLENKSILWVDVTQGNIDKYFYRYFMLTLKQIKPKYWRYRTSQKDLRLLNGQMHFRSAERPESIEGFGYHLIIINEAGLIFKGQKGRNLWFNSIYPMVLDYGSQVKVIIGGTPKGKKAKKDEKVESQVKWSLYYEFACKGGLKNPDGIEKKPNYKTLTYTSYDNPLLSPADIEELEGDVPRITRKQEIHAQFIDANDESVFKQAWFHIVRELPPMHTWLRKVISLDTAFKKGAENDDSAGVCWLETTVGFFWLDCFCKKLSFPELIEETITFYNRNPGSTLILIEDAASGQSLIDMFKVKINQNDLGNSYPVLPIKVNTDKYSRSVAVSPMLEGGQCHVLSAHWNEMGIDQMCSFNALMDTPDDIVDSNTQILNYFKGNIRTKTQIHSKPMSRTSKILEGYD
jgi:predicted phage terminase large subunit-like protein